MFDIREHGGGYGGVDNKISAMLANSKKLSAVSSYVTLSGIRWTGKFIARNSVGNHIYLSENSIYLVNKDTFNVLTIHTHGDTAFEAFYDKATESIIYTYRSGSFNFIKKLNALNLSIIVDSVRLSDEMNLREWLVTDTEVWIKNSVSAYQINRYNKNTFALIATIILSTNGYYPKLYNGKVYVKLQTRQLAEYSLDGLFIRDIGVNGVYLSSVADEGFVFHDGFIYEAVTHTQGIRKSSLEGTKIWDCMSSANIQNRTLFNGALWVAGTSSICKISLGGVEEYYQNMNIATNTFYADELNKTLNASMVSSDYYVPGSIIEGLKSK